MKRKRKPKRNSKALYKSVLEVYGKESVERTFTLSEETLSKIEYQAGVLEVNQSLLVEALLAVGLELAIAYHKANNFKDIPTMSKHYIKSQYGEKKKKVYSVTKESDIALSKLATKLNTYRNEIIEWAVRGGGLIDASDYLLAKLNNQ